MWALASGCWPGTSSARAQNAAIPDRLVAFRAVAQARWELNSQRPLLLVGVSLLDKGVPSEWPQALRVAEAEEVGSTTTAAQVVRPVHGADMSAWLQERCVRRERGISALAALLGACDPGTAARIRSGDSVMFCDLSMPERSALREVLTLAESPDGDRPLTDALDTGGKESYLRLHAYPCVYVFPAPPSLPFAVGNVPLIDRRRGWRPPPTMPGNRGYVPGSAVPEWVARSAEMPTSVAAGQAVDVDAACRALSATCGRAIIAHRELGKERLLVFVNHPVTLLCLLDGLLLGLRAELRAVGDAWFVVPLRGVDEVASRYRAANSRLQALSQWSDSLNPWPGVDGAPSEPFPASFRAHTGPREAESLSPVEADFLIRRIGVLGADLAKDFGPRWQVEFVDGFTLELHAPIPALGTVTGPDPETGRQREFPVRQAIQVYFHVY